MTTLIQWNCNGIQSKQAELQLLIKEHDPAIIALQETRTSPRSNTKTKGYQTLFNHRPSGQGGVAIMLKNGINYTQNHLTSSLEIISVNVNTPYKMTIASLYIPPNSQLNIDELDKIIDSLPKPLIIAGDLNAHDKSWDPKRQNARGREINKVIEKHGLTTLNDGQITFIHSATRNEQNSTSAIDVTICSPELAAKLDWQIINDQHSSDHFPIKIGTSSSNSCKQQRPRWKIEEADWKNFEAVLENLIHPDNEYTTDQITDAIKKAATASIPKTSKLAHPKSVPWWNERTKAAVRSRRKALRKLKNTPVDNTAYKSIHEEFCKTRYESRKIIEEEKQNSWLEYISGINENTPPKEVWKKIRSIYGKKTADPIWTITTANGNISDPKEIAEHLASHFAKESADETYSPEFLTKKAKRERKPIIYPRQRNAAYNEAFNITELIFQLDTLKGTSPGPDEIHNEMLKRLPFYIKKKLLEAFNKIWSTGSFPQNWRESILIPIPKPGKATNDPKNLRPIYLSSCMMKLFERMVNRRLMNELESKNILGKNQYAFRKGRQTLDPLTEIEEICSNAINEHKHVELLFLDIEKAYDKTWRYLIKENLAKAGIGGHMAKFCENFLQERRFRTLFQGHESTSKIQHNGVPQGSVLAVTFFLIAINSIKEWLPENTIIKIYADDITIAVSSRSARWTRLHIQKILNKIEKWSNETGFTISTQKTTIMHVGNRRKLQKQPLAIFRNKVICSTKITKVLGVWLDHKLNYKHHIQKKREECKTVISLMRCISGTTFGADRKSLLRLVNSMLVPKLLYAAPIISRANETDLDRLNPLYHQGIRIATGAFHSSPIESLLAESGQIPLKLKIAELLILYSAKQTNRKTIPPECSLAQRALQKMELLQIPTVNIDTHTPNYNRPAQTYGINLEISNSTTTAEKKARFLEIRESKYRNHHHIYTDGSKTSHGTGCGIFSDNFEASINLPNNLSIFSAETFAINKALDILPNELSVIFSDSKSALLAIKNHECTHPWIDEIRKKLLDHPGMFELCWVPAHINISGNENADKLAKKATTEQTTEIINTPFDDFKRNIRTHIRMNWEQTWNRNSSHLREIKNNTIEWTSSHQSKRKESIILTRLRIGHSRITHGHFARKESESTCTTCGIKTSVKHIIIDCPKYDEARIESKIANSLFIALGDDQTEIKKTISFINKAQLTNEI